MKESVILATQKVPLLDTSTLHRVELLAEDVSIAVDESTDNTDVAQLGTHFCDEHLRLIPLEGRTGEILFQKIVSFFHEYDLELGKICLLATDGASAMIGRVQGLVGRHQQSPQRCSFYTV